jgi:hypothetical protein
MAERSGRTVDQLMQSWTALGLFIYEKIEMNVGIPRHVPTDFF